MLKRTHSPYGQKYTVSEGHTDLLRRGPDPGWWRDGTCAEVECPHYLKGWVTIVPTISIQADYIRRNSKRRFVERREVDLTGTEQVAQKALSEFTFEPGQRCFGRVHKIKLGRPPLYLRNGELIDWERWFEEFNEDFEKAARR